MAFSDSLKKFRKDLKLTQKQVAEAIGIQTNAYQAYEYGKVKPSVDVVEKLAVAFKVSADYLLGLDEIRNSQEGYLLNDFRELTPDGQRALMDYAEFLRIKHRKFQDEDYSRSVVAV